MNGARRVLVIAIVVLGVLAAPALASAHPLGNFTINTAAGLVVGVDEVLLDYAVDMAEIPALQEERRLDLDGDGSRSSEELEAYRVAACEELRRGAAAPDRRGRRAPDPALVGTVPAPRPGGVVDPAAPMRLRRRDRSGARPRPQVRGSDVPGQARLARGHGGG